MYGELQYELWKKVVARLPKRKAKVKPKKRPVYSLRVYKGANGTILVQTYPMDDRAALYRNGHTIVYKNISSFMYNWDIEFRFVLIEKTEEVTNDFDPEPF